MMSRSAKIVKWCVDKFRHLLWPQNATEHKKISLQISMFADKQGKRYTVVVLYYSML
jgi:alkyl hydroperoxide reductase subunit AhpC